jgi:hypothetical protein
MVFEQMVFYCYKENRNLYFFFSLTDVQPAKLNNINKFYGYFNLYVSADGWLSQTLIDQAIQDESHRNTFW